MTWKVSFRVPGEAAMLEVFSGETWARKYAAVITRIGYRDVLVIPPGGLRMDLVPAAADTSAQHGGAAPTLHVDLLPAAAKTSAQHRDFA